MDRQEQLNDYVQQNDFFRQALSKLKKGREIAISVEGEFDSVIFIEGGEVKIEFRTPKNADVRFTANDAAIEKILATKYDSVGDFGLAVVKFVAKGDMGIKILTGPFKLLTSGYIDIVRLGGARFLSGLGEFGIKGPGDILNVFRKMKK